MQETTTLCYLLALTGIQGIGPITIQALIRRFGTPETIWQMNPACLQPHLSKTAYTAWELAYQEQKKHLQAAEDELKRAEDAGITMLSYDDPQYPQALKTLKHAPPILSVAGTLLPQDFLGIAIVGTRSCSNYGLEMAHTFAMELAKLGFTISSGLARGIDTKAHMGALQAGRTLAHLGSGLLRIYPAENKELAKQISQNGAVVSSFALNAAPDRKNFPKRNEHVALLSRATLLIEAPIDSGAMITTEYAKTFGRPVFALPGRIDQESFQGNLQLIKQSAAALVSTPREIAAALGTALSTTPSHQTAAPSIELPQDEAALYKAIGKEEICLDEIAIQYKAPASQLSVLLMKLVLKKKIKELPGKRYARV